MSIWKYNELSAFCSIQQPIKRLRFISSIFFKANFNNLNKDDKTAKTQSTANIMEKVSKYTKKFVLEKGGQNIWESMDPARGCQVL